MDAKIAPQGVTIARDFTGLLAFRQLGGAADVQLKHGSVGLAAIIPLLSSLMYRHVVALSRYNSRA